MTKVAVGSDVKLRGRAPHGYLKRINDRGWAWVDWRSQPPGPVIRHVGELEPRIATRPADMIEVATQ